MTWKYILVLQVFFLIVALRLICLVLPGVFWWFLSWFLHLDFSLELESRRKNLKPVSCWANIYSNNIFIWEAATNDLSPYFVFRKTFDSYIFFGHQISPENFSICCYNIRNMFYQCIYKELFIEIQTCTPLNILVGRIFLARLLSILRNLWWNQPTIWSRPKRRVARGMFAVG